MFPKRIDFRRIFQLAEAFVVLALLLGRSALPPGDEAERVRAFTRNIEFDFVTWTLDALFLKFDQFALGTNSYLSDDVNAQILLDYIDVIRGIQQLEGQLGIIYADPDVPDPDAASADVRQELDDLYEQKAALGPLAESILQSQLRSMLKELDLTVGGQPIPPVLYHSTPLPSALIVSPRDMIQQDNNIPISPDLTLDAKIALEDQVAEALNVSTLVVPIGGIGTYPTMISQTSNLKWLAEVVAHEWIHNFFNLRPLGLNYLSSPELRTMNETAASIAGKEIGRALIAVFYPELLPPPPPPPKPEGNASPEPPPEPVFDFNAEMRITRVTVDKLLTEGEIEKAEAYMEARRLFLWDNGYRIRKLNQAYFAFHGAYADMPGGAAGVDPVGEAVRTLRAQSSTLADFLDAISWMSSFEQLQDAVRAP